jgi:cytochrome b subunit of formate dehydrogenase
MRMYKFERLVHALLVLSFVLLAWTGFQLKYPEQWWARPALAIEGDWTVRGFIHRSAAAVFVCAALLHLVSLFANGELRRHWMQLWPKLSDVTDAARSLAFSLGLSSTAPPHTSVGFIEKAQYWFVAWSAVMMSATGALLWAHDAMLQRLPKALLDAATAMHFYEAVLACIVLVGWHLYFTIFDPDVYPMDTSWIAGDAVRRREETVERASLGAKTLR